MLVKEQTLKEATRFGIKSENFTLGTEEKSNSTSKK